MPVRSGRLSDTCCVTLSFHRLMITLRGEERPIRGRSIQDGSHRMPDATFGALTTDRLLDTTRIDFGARRGFTAIAQARTRRLRTHGVAASEQTANVSTILLAWYCRG